MKIKICGLTKPEEARYLNENKVDFAGVVMFFPKSRRNTEPDMAKQILCALSPQIKKTAVVVSPTPEQIGIIAGCGFDYIQIHSTLSKEVLDASPLPILKAFNISDMEQYEYFHSADKIHGYVFDSPKPGSGKTFDWNLVRSLPRDDKLFFLAGGLDPENVKDAIRALKPDGVDISSGVEYKNGGKDPRKIELFVKNVREALL
ncbi:MAG: phosphoribosylanthranilate isomerase [Clostridiales bacterium]|nr:phosphoribosylanthranilate isomerase [Clostridiales bacterium]